MSLSAQAKKPGCWGSVLLYMVRYVTQCDTSLKYVTAWFVVGGQRATVYGEVCSRFSAVEWGKGSLLRRGGMERSSYHLCCLRSRGCLGGTGCMVPEAPSSVKHVAVEGIKLLLTFSGDSGMWWVDVCMDRVLDVILPFWKNLLLCDEYIYNNIFCFFYFTLNCFFVNQKMGTVGTVSSWTLIGVQSLYLFADRTSLMYFQGKPADCLDWALCIIQISTLPLFNSLFCPWFNSLFTSPRQ